MIPYGQQVNLVINRVEELGHKIQEMSDELDLEGQCLVQRRALQASCRALWVRWNSTVPVESLDSILEEVDGYLMDRTRSLRRTARIKGLPSYADCIGKVEEAILPSISVAFRALRDEYKGMATITS